MSVPELREYTLEYYLENYGGKSISKNFFKEDNIQIEFFNTAGKKATKTYLQRESSCFGAFRIAY